MAGLNSVQIQGHLVKKPELQTTQSGNSFCKFSVANNIRAGSEDYVNFFDCIAWAKAAEIISKYFDKGTQIVIQGELRQNRWEKEGQTMSRIEIKVEKFHFCGYKKNDNQQFDNHNFSNIPF